MRNVTHPPLNGQLAELAGPPRSNGLVVEIDGPGHRRPRTRREDATRDAILNAAGYSVLRLTPNELT